MAMYGNIWLYMAYMAIYGCVGLRRAMYGYVWPCIAV